MNRDEHNERLAASHARAESEERNESPQDRWMRGAIELDAEMKTLLNELGGDDNDSSLEPF